MRLLLRVGLVLVTLVAMVLGGLLMLGTKERPLPEVVPGYHTTEITVPHRDVPLPLSVWYPTEARGEAELIGQNLLFYGFHAQRDAAPVDAPLPVVVLVHGSGGNGPRMGWLAVSLVEAGYIVVAANHPGVTSQDSWPEETVKIWERPQDVSVMLNWLNDAAPLGLNPDMDRVGVLGFSIGGHTALALAGIEVSKDAFLNYCATYDDAVDCQWMLRSGLDLMTIDASRYEASQADPRPVAFVAIDPALPRAVKDESFANVQRPVQLINLADPAGLSSAVDVDNWPTRLGDARYHAVPLSWHFSFLAECSTTGRLVIGLLSRKTEEICTDIKGRSRADVHRELREVILPFFAETL